MINTKILKNMSSVNLQVSCPRCNCEFSQGLTSFDYYCPVCELEFVVICEIKMNWKDGQKDAREIK